MTTFHKQQPFLSDQFSKTPKFFKSNHCIWNVAKYNLGKVRLKLMQSAVFPCTVRDLQNGPFGDLLGFCVMLPFLLQCCLLIFADLLRSICESLQILAPSPPSHLVAGLKVIMDQVSCFHWLFSVMVPVSGHSWGWFPLPGLPWIPPLWLMAFAPR